MTETMWMVRAGRGGRFVQEFIDKSIVGIGWSEVGDATQCRDKAELLQRFENVYPDDSPKTRDVGASQVFRFMRVIADEDWTTTYDTNQRLYHIGQVKSSVYFSESVSDGHTVLIRDVSWLGHVSRDVLTETAQLGLGSIATLFRVRPDVAAELRDKALGTISTPALEAGRGSVVVTPVIDVVGDTIDPFLDLAETALQRTTDRIVRLSWTDMQELVAALLRTLGYRTTVSPPGADRGKDIFASRDGFGFEQPRIVVEVKHRPGSAMGAPEIRGFLGGRHVEDRGLYVSTGGFTREAYYEAERAKIPLTLLTLDDLARELVRNYDKLDEDGRRMLPLKRIYWPE